MDTKPEFLMDTKSWIQLGSVLVALIALIVQQNRLVKEARSKEKRIETKLRIFYILSRKDRSQGEIIDEFKQQGPTAKSIDEAEIRKSLYEMMADETIYYQRDKTYRAHWRNPKEEKGTQQKTDD
jgi:hypothetical protein